MIEQRTVEWYLERNGSFTGSSISKLMGKGRKKDEIFSQTALTYIYKVASERMLSDKVFELPEVWEMYQNQVSAWSKAIQFGIDWEDDAKEQFTKVTGIEVEETTSISHNEIEHFSASPDGLVSVNGQRGVVEVKCPLPSTFVNYSTNIIDAETLKSVETDYYYQMQTEMCVSDSSFGFFIAFSPFMKKPLHIVRIERNNDDIAEIEERVKLANEMVDAIIQKRLDNEKMLLKSIK